MPESVNGRYSTMMTREQYYDDEGLLMTERTKDNHRLYDRQAMKRIWEILVYKEMDFELREIRQIFQSTEEEKNQWLDRRRDVISRQIEEQKQKIAIIAFVQKYGMPPVPQENCEKSYVECIREMIAEISSK